MSARNMVRNLRDSGALASKPPAPEWRASAVFFVSALVFGALVYLGAAYALPGAMKLVEKKPVAVAYARPGGGAVQTAAVSPDAKPFTRTDELACERYGVAARKRINAEIKKKLLDNPFALNAGTGKIGWMSAQLVCEAQTRPMRLCDDSERALFVERSKPYFDEVATMAGIFGGALDASAFSMMPHRADEIVAAKSIAQTGMKQVADIHKKVAGAFRDLAVRGLISEADFAGGLFGAPDAVKAMFTDLPAVQPVCPAI